ncbi:hypothetical protein E4U11_005646 [Claviceps purpurea]|nr:hypothetical protein E4U11_005646 [Claviceps purpurea]
MDFTQSMFMLLLSKSPCLEYLKIENLPANISFPTDGRSWNQLRHFSLEGGEYGFLYQRPVEDPGGFPCLFLQDAAGSLEHLDFVGIPEEWYTTEDPFIPFLPKLKTLRLNEQHHFHLRRSDSAEFSLPLYPLAVAFPRLEQLCIGDDIPYFDPEPVSIWRDKRDDIWPHLKVLIFEVTHYEEPSLNTARTRSALRCLTCLNRGNSLKHIELEFYWGWSERDIFSGGDDLLPDSDIVQDAEFKNLRSFKSRTLSIPPKGARNLLSKAVQTNQLTSFDIVFPLNYPHQPGWSSREDRDVGERHADHLKGYDWVRGAPSIQSLGCYALCLNCPSENEQEHFLLHFLASFPNLRTLSIDCYFDEMDDYASFLVEILRFTHLETIYTCHLQVMNSDVVYHKGGAAARLMQAARDRGVQLMALSDLSGEYVSDPSPREWPVSLEE